MRFFPLYLSFALLGGTAPAAAESSICAMNGGEAQPRIAVPNARIKIDHSPVDSCKSLHFDLALAGQPAVRQGDTKPVEASLLDFGAAGDGLVDDTDAIQRWIDRLGPHTHGIVPAGVYKFTRPLLVLTSDISVSGAGPYQSTFSFAGPANIGDLITVGDGKREVTNWNLSNIRVTSTTKLTAGSALRLRKVVRSALSDITIDGQDGNGNLWDGIWFDAIDFVTVQRFEVRSQLDAVRINGAAGAGPKADLMMSQGKIAGSGIGIHVGGGFGGLFVDNIDIIDNQRNVVVDTTLAGKGNRELFFGPNTAIDSASQGCAFTLADTLAGPEAWLQFNGSWVASGVDCGILIEADTKWIISIQGGTIFNFKSDGIRNLSKDVNLILNGVVIRNNLGAGLSSVQSNEALQNALFIKNHAGRITRSGAVNHSYSDHF